MKLRKVTLVTALALTTITSVAGAHSTTVNKTRAYVTKTKKPAAKKQSVQQVDQKKINDHFNRLVNAERRKAGIKPIAYNAAQFNVAKIRSDEQAAYGSLQSHGKPHTRPDGRTWRSALAEATAKFGTRATNAAENILERPVSGVEGMNEAQLAQALFEQWKSSHGHYTNFMDPDHIRGAVSVSYGVNAGGSPILIATQILGR